MLARLMIGYILALPLIVPLTARSAGKLQRFTLAVTMQSRLPGHLQVFYDSGSGFAEAQSSAVALQVSDGPREYRLALPPGHYRSFRIDPGTLGGTYVIERAAILAPGGLPYAAIPLMSLAPSGQASVTERRRDRLVVNAQPGFSDPQLLYVPETPILIPNDVPNPPVRRELARIVLFWMCGIGIVWLLERAFHAGWPKGALPVASLAAACARAPRLVVCLVAAFTTIAATYPVLLLGRSLVSPNNHGVMLLSGDLQFGPDSRDFILEDVRGSDVAAALLQDIPHSNVQRQALAQGEIPLWNRYNADGRPLWAQGLSFLGDPLHWLTLLTPDPALGWDLKFVTHRFVFSLGVGLAALVATGGWLPAAIVAAASPWGGLNAGTG